MTKRFSKCEHCDANLAKILTTGKGKNTTMELVGKAKLRSDISKYSGTKRGVERWIKIVEGAEWSHIEEVKKTLPSADFARNTETTIFKIKGNDYRIITKIDYSLKRIYYLFFLPHAEYTKRKL